MLVREPSLADKRSRAKAAELLKSATMRLSAREICSQGPYTAAAEKHAREQAEHPQLRKIARAETPQS